MPHLSPMTWFMIPMMMFSSIMLLLIKLWFMPPLYYPCSNSLSTSQMNYSWNWS